MRLIVVAMQFLGYIPLTYISLYDILILRHGSRLMSHVSSFKFIELSPIS